MEYWKWYHRFLVIFAIMAVAVVAGAWIGSGLPQRDRILVTGIVLALVAWFITFGQYDRIRSDLHAIVYLLGNAVGIAVLIRTWDSGALLLFPAFWFGFAYLLTGPAIAYSAVLTIGMQWGFGTFDRGFTLSWNSVAGIGLLIVILAFSGFMARYIEAFQSEAQRNRELYRQLQVAQEQLAMREREAGVEDERKRLAGEIHDTIAQQFTSVITNLQAAENTVTHDPQTAKGHVQNAVHAATQGLSDCRALLSTMQPDVLSGRTLQAVLEETINEAHKQHSYSIELHIQGDAQLLSRPVETMLVRALQESLRNIAKHARATNVSVTLSWLEDEVLLDIQDDGIGFEPEEIVAGESGNRMGLLTMEHRVERAGGTFALESTPGEGTSIAVSFPTGDAT